MLDIRADKLGRPHVERDMHTGRWKRDPGAEWDWFYALPADQRSFIQVNYMVKGGIRPDVLASRCHMSVDEWAEEWLEVIRDVQRGGRDPLEWWPEEREEPAEWDRSIPELVGMRGIAELLGVSPSTPRQWKARGQLPPPTMVIDGTFAVWTVESILEWFAKD